MRYLVVLFVVLGLVSMVSLGANPKGELVLLKLKNYDLDSIPYFIDNLGSEELKKAFRYQYNRLTTQDNISTFELEDKKEADNFERAIIYYTYADYLKSINQDSLAFKHYINAYDTAKNSNSQEVLNTSLYKLNYFLLKGNKVDPLVFGSYVQKYKQSARDSLDRFWSAYFENLQVLQFKSRNKMELAEIDFQRLERTKKLLPKNDYLLGKFYHLKGKVYSTFVKDYKLAIENYEKALQYFAYVDYSFVEEDKYASTFNIANAKFRSKSYEEAIKDWLRIKKSDHYKKNKYIHLNLNKWLYKAYDSLNQKDSVLFYLKELDRIKDQQKTLKLAAAIKHIDAKYNLDEKQEAIDKLDQENSKIQKNFYTVLPILGIVTAILVITFLLYRRYKNRSSKLEDEKSETLQKLDELKNIIIKNHIILKDKTKVYISDLIYIKSEDHYLKIFTSDGKNNFVRGKLSSIKEELPPNFIQCHRSYIVNSNFIKRANNDTIFLIDKTQIPLSRSFKSRFRK